MAKARFAYVQQLGRALMLPIAVLPVAGLLLRLGQADLLNIKLMAQAGEAIFTNLALLFAIGVAVGFAHDNAGVAGLAGAVGYLVLLAVLKTVDDKINPGVLAGILSGLCAGALYNRYWNIRLPEYLAFFGGKRFVPIITGLVCLVLGLILSVLWPPLQRGIDGVGHWLLGAGALGVFVYGVLNRVLLITGLHHILNSLVWFVFGSYGAPGHVVTGDIHRFFAGDPTAGTFMTGFFPIMMFGLPAACLAMYRTAQPENRRAVAGLLLSMALTSFLTGVTEQIEFTFLFLAPMLYGAHALLTGLSLALMSALGVRLGFTFSAGAIDYLLSYGLSSRGWLLIPIGLAYAVVYYGIFVVCIRRFQLVTPGREPPVEETVPEPRRLTADAARALAFVEALGGAGNLHSIDACTTRLRLTVAASDAVDEPALKRLGAKAVVRPAPHSIQVVLGPEADRLAGEIRANLALATKPNATVDAPVDERRAWLAALGGEHNLLTFESVATTRLRAELIDASLIDEPALERLGARGVMHLSRTLVHVIVGARSATLAASLQPSSRPVAAAR